MTYHNGENWRFIIEDKVGCSKEMPPRPSPSQIAEMLYEIGAGKVVHIYERVDTIGKILQKSEG